MYEGAHGGGDVRGRIKQDRFHAVFAAAVDPVVAQLMAATQRLITATAPEDIASN